MKFNHELTENSVKYSSKTGSRTRVRIPVAGTRHIGIQPGDKVHVTVFQNKVSIKPLRQRYSSKAPWIYTVEKDGAIRIPANKWGLRTQGLTVTCDQLEGNVTVF